MFERLKESIEEHVSLTDQEYENRKEYHAYHGEKLQNLPEQTLDKTAADYLQWYQ